MSDIGRFKRKKKEYYDIRPILSHKAQYNMVIGEKGNGKSFQAKKLAITDAYNDKGEFLYMRRYDKHIRETDVYSYFGDAPIKEWTDGEYEGIALYRKFIYFCNYDENDKPVRGKEAGRIVALNMYEQLTSQTYPHVSNIIFEEFITRGLYIDNEPVLLMNFVSTVARDDDICVWLMGNSISRVNPYFQTWCLRNIPRQKVGTIDDYYFTRTDADGEQITTKIAVERCKNLGTKSKMFFGDAGKMITGGSWDTHEYPHLPRDDEGKLKPYKSLYEVLLINMGYKFVLQYCIDEKTGGTWVYVYPYTKNRRIRRVITDDFSTDPFVTSSLISNIPAEVKIHNLIALNKICYSDNLTGSDFEAITQNMKGRL